MLKVPRVCEFGELRRSKTRPIIYDCPILPMKRTQKFAFANSSSHGMARYGGEIENGDFDKGKDANVGRFW